MEDSKKYIWFIRLSQQISYLLVKDKAFPLRRRIKQGCMLLFNTELEFLARATRQEKNNTIQIAKEEVKPYFHR